MLLVFIIYFPFKKTREKRFEFLPPVDLVVVVEAISEDKFRTIMHVITRV